VVVARDSGRAWVVTAIRKNLLGRDDYAVKDTNAPTLPSPASGGGRYPFGPRKWGGRFPPGRERDP